MQLKLGWLEDWRLKPRLYRQNPPPRVEDIVIKIRLEDWRLKTRLYRQNPPPRVEDITLKITWARRVEDWRLKPRLYRQNPPPRVEDIAIKITLLSSVRGGGLPLCRRGFNRRLARGLKRV